jgi:hypothetical protein
VSHLDSSQVARKPTAIVSVNARTYSDSRVRVLTSASVSSVLVSEGQRFVAYIYAIEPGDGTCYSRTIDRHHAFWYVCTPVWVDLTKLCQSSKNTAKGIKEGDHHYLRLALPATDGMISEGSPVRMKAHDQRVQRSDCISLVAGRGWTDEIGWPTFLDVIQHAILEAYKSGQMMGRREEIGWHSYEVIERCTTCRTNGVGSLPGPALVIWTDA